MQKKKINTYRWYKITLISLVAIYIIFAAIMLLFINNINGFFIIAAIMGLCIILVAVLFGLFIASGVSEKNSIRIIELCFDRDDIGVKQLMEIVPTIFINHNYINTYLYNLHDRCYYEIYVKDEIRWIRNIGKRNPKEKYYYES